MIAYTVFQFPAGWFLDWFGARVILSTAAFGWPLTTACTGVVGSLRAVAGVTVVALVLIRIGLGVFEAPSFPGAVRVISRWFPDRARAIAHSWMMTAANLAPSITTPLVAMMVAWAGWQSMLLVSALPALLIGILWLRFVRNDPQAHPQISPEELLHIGVHREAAAAQSGYPALRALLFDRSMLTLSFTSFCGGYVSTLFLLYLYLVSAKGFSVLDGGWLASVPVSRRRFSDAFWGGARWPVGRRLGSSGRRSSGRRARERICSGSVIAGSYASSAYLGLACFL